MPAGTSGYRHPDAHSSRTRSGQDRGLRLWFCFADRGDPATDAVLDALELADRVVLLDEITLNTELAQAPAALLIDTTWTSRLADAHAAGHTTALIDRFGVVDAGRGQADLTAPNLAGLLPGIAGWLDALATNRERAS